LNRLAQPLRALLAADHGDWQPLLERWASSGAGHALIDAIDARVRTGAKVYPAQVFRALALTPLAQTRVVILGQDPYHGPGQAEGLAFSVAPGQRLPPSLRNIFKELGRDVGCAAPPSGSLLPWARQGVLLLNTALTVEDGQPAAHAKLGWHVLTDEICLALACDTAPKAFMLWGAHAQSKAGLIAQAGAHHAVLQCNHPSPLSALRPPQPFIGSGHFSRANLFLTHAGRGAVRWAQTAG
jgi:uracil-DNA glycosylase